MDEKLLGIYLNDHHAGALAGLELAQRAAGNNTGSELGTFLLRLHAEFKEDRNALGTLMETLDVSKDPLKAAGGWIAEKAGRLKLNGQLMGYSPLSRLVELEGLIIGIQGKKELWLALKKVSDHDPRLAVQDFDALIARAEKQQEGLEEHRLEAARTAFS